MMRMRMPRWMLHALTTISVVTSGSLRAQIAPEDSARRVVPGDSALHGARLVASSRRYALTLFRDGDEIPVGTLIDSLWADSTDRVITLHRVKTLQRGPTRLVDTTITDRETLAPRVHRSQLPNRRVTLDFTGRRVKGALMPQDVPSVPIDTILPQVAFDAASWDLVAGALPLAKGLVVHFPVYDVDAGLRRYQIAVTGSTMVNGDACWIVVLTLARGRESVAWISESSRRVVKMETTMGTTILIQQGR
ncbi:MAG: hypothetical protein RLZZ621_984 [Gemmatimonadota bacterium]